MIARAARDLPRRRACHHLYSAGIGPAVSRRLTPMNARIQMALVLGFFILVLIYTVAVMALY